MVEGDPAFIRFMLLMVWWWWLIAGFGSLFRDRSVEGGKLGTLHVLAGLEGPSFALDG
jgi:hypothetical protein